MPRVFDRRQFLLTSSSIGCAIVAVGLDRPADAADKPGSKANAKTNPGNDETILFQPAAHDLFRVRMEMSLEGNVNVPTNSLISKERAHQLPIRATSTIDYEELLARNDQQRPTAARRYYYEATSDSTVAERTQQSTLRKEARRTTAHLSNGPLVIVGDNEYLTRDEIELLNTPLCSLALDAVLPTKEMRSGEKWNIDNTFLPTFFNLDAIQRSSVVGEIVTIEPAAVKMQLKGRIDGSVEGVPTSMDVAGKVTYDRTTQSISWVAIAVRELRDIGKARPGFEVGATIKLIRQSIDKPNALVNVEPVDLSKGIPAKKMVVQLESSHGAFAAFMDRDWRIISDAAGLATLRMVVNDKAISQCEIRPLPSLKPGEQLTLEAFQVEVQKSLEKRFGEFLEAEEGLNGMGLRTIRVAVQGQVQDVPVQWVFLQFSDDQGRRLGATFTVESSQVETFSGSDAQLANSLSFREKSPSLQATAPLNSRKK